MNTLPVVRRLPTGSCETAIIVNTVVFRGGQINILSLYIRCCCGFVINIVLHYFKNIGSRVKWYYGFEIHFPTSLTYRQIQNMEKGNANLGNGHVCRKGETHSHSVSFPGREGQVYEKLDTLLLGDINQSAFLAYETFEGYWRQCDTSIEDFLINFG